MNPRIAAELTKFDTVLANYPPDKEQPNKNTTQKTIRERIQKGETLREILKTMNLNNTKNGKEIRNTLRRIYTELYSNLPEESDGVKFIDLRDENQHASDVNDNHESLVCEAIDLVLKHARYKSFDNVRKTRIHKTFNYNYKDTASYFKNNAITDNEYKIIADMLFVDKDTLIDVEKLKDSYSECELTVSPTHYLQNRLKSVIKKNEKRVSPHKIKFLAYLDNPNDVDEEYVSRIQEFHTQLLNCYPIISVVRPDKDKTVAGSFGANLMDFSSNISYESMYDFTTAMFDENNEHNYLNCECSDRSMTNYKRFVIDIDCEDFDDDKFINDMKFLNFYLYSNDDFMEDLTVYWCIDYNFKNNISSIKEIIGILQTNIPSTTDESKHIIKHWYNPNLKKNLSIHIYHSGKYFNAASMKDFKYVANRCFKRKIETTIENSQTQTSTCCDSYIDFSIYNTGQRMMRLPYSGKLMDKKKPRKPIKRFDKDMFVNNDDMIAFFSECTINVDLEKDKFSSYFNRFYMPSSKYNRSTTVYQNEITKKMPKSALSSDAKPKSEIRYRDDDRFYIPDNGSQFLVNEMIKVVNSIRGYQEHFKARCVFINNCIILGLNEFTILSLLEDLKIQRHSSTEENEQVEQNYDYVCDNVQCWNDSFFKNQHGQPILFKYDTEMMDLLRKTTFDYYILKIIIGHLFIQIAQTNVIYKQIDELNNNTYVYSYPVCKTRLDTDIFDEPLHFTLKNEVCQCYLRKFITIANPLKNYMKFKTGLKPTDDSSNIYDICPYVYGLGKEKTFADRPKEITHLLHCFLDDTTSGFTKEQQEERINHFETAIINKLQRPYLNPGRAVWITSREGVGKSIYARLLRELFPLISDNASMDRDLARFNANSCNQLIVFYNEASDNISLNEIKKIITEDVKQVEEKFGKVRFVDNLSLKIFFTNEKNSKYITPTDRRFDVFRSTHINSDKEIALMRSPGYLFDVDDDSEFRKDLKEKYYDYLMNVKIPKSYNSHDLPTSVALTQNKADLIERQCNGDSLTVKFIRLLFQTLKTSVLENSDNKQFGYKALSIQECVDIMNHFKLDKNDGSEIVGLFNSAKDYDEAYDIYSQDFTRDDKKTEQWSVNKLNMILENHSEFETQRVSESRLKIPEIAKDHYRTRTFIIYNLSDQVEY